MVALITVIFKTQQAFKTVKINSTLNWWIDFSFIKILLFFLKKMASTQLFVSQGGLIFKLSKYSKQLLNSG